MQFRINLDNLFNNTQHGQLNTSSESHSAQLSHSIDHSLAQSFDYKYTFNNHFFEQQENQEPEFIHSSKELSEIQVAPQSVKSLKTIKTANSGRSQMPGERLFYQSQMNQAKKIKDKERMEQQEKIEMRKTMTFVPEINENSRKMAEKIKYESKQVGKKKQNELKPTKQVQEDAQYRECTFKPKLVAKSVKTYPKSKQQLFYYLHNTSKIKEIKLNKMIEDEYSKIQQINKKGSEGDFMDFLKRNEEYTSIVKKKQQLLKLNSEQYDLKTGQKLFIPKISDSKAYNFHSTIPVKQLKKNSSKNIQSQQQSIKKIGPSTPQANRNPTLNSPTAQNYSSNKPKSGIFSKKLNTDSHPIEDYNNLKYTASTYKKPVIEQLVEEHIIDDQNLEYQRYSEQYQRKKLMIEGSKGSHQIIPQESQHAYNEHSHFKEYSGELEGSLDNFDPQEVEGEVGCANIWGSNEIIPFELSNVHQYLNASEEDQQQLHSNNYVMKILNNLQSKRMISDLN